MSGLLAVVYATQAPSGDAEKPSIQPLAGCFLLEASCRVVPMLQAISLSCPALGESCTHISSAIPAGGTLVGTAGAAWVGAGSGETTTISGVGGDGGSVGAGGVGEAVGATGVGEATTTTAVGEGGGSVGVTGSGETTTTTAVGEGGGSVGTAGVAATFNRTGVEVGSDSSTGSRVGVWIGTISVATGGAVSAGNCAAAFDPKNEEVTAAWTVSAVEVTDLAPAGMGVTASSVAATDVVAGQSPVPARANVGVSAPTRFTVSFTRGVGRSLVCVADGAASGSVTVSLSLAATAAEMTGDAARPAESGGVAEERNENEGRRIVPEVGRLHADSRTRKKPRAVKNATRLNMVIPPYVSDRWP